MKSRVAAFPLHRQRRLVTGIANVLRAKQGEAATLFWRETAKDLLHQLSVNGVDAGSAQDQVRGLLYAVLTEIEAGAVKARG